MASDDLARPQFGEAALGRARGTRESPVDDRSGHEVEREDDQRDADGEQRRIDEVGHPVGQRDVVLADQALGAGDEDDAEVRQVRAG